MHLLMLLYCTVAASAAVGCDPDILAAADMLVGNAVAKHCKVGS